ncbi:MAG: NUDIX hydrolase [Desulfuromonadales bacterium]|nr:MAG: NUDIX hydrolase [Desulfuromonadales bacterium]
MHDRGQTIVVGCLVKNDEGQILMVRHHERGWEFPQGRMEEGESLTDAAHREVFEETGTRIEVGPLAAVWSKLTSPSAVIFTFIARYLEGDLRTSEETPEVGWFTVDDAPALITHPITRDRFRVILDFSGTIPYLTYTTHPYQITGTASLT